MQAVILAAGEGRRMLPLTLSCPKPLLKVLGKPILVHIMDALPDAITEVVLVVGYKEEMIREYFGDTFNGRSITYVTQDKPEGTFKALEHARPHLVGKFLLLNADDIHGTKALIEALKHPLALIVSPHKDPQKFGVVSLHGDGTLKEIVEKPEEPPTNLVSTGAMVLDERVFEYSVLPSPGGEYYLPLAVTELAKEAPIAVVVQETWIPLGCPEDIAPAEERLQKIEETGQS